MSTALAVQHEDSLATLDAEMMKELIAGGDCARLSDAQKLAYYRARCDAAGLDPRTQPFEFMRLNNKLQLYAKKGASDQLTAKHGLSTRTVSQETVDGIRLVVVQVQNKDGRVGDDTGAVSVKGLSGDALANALMKCVTKAKRRAVLSFCGLGMLDESEVETIPAAQRVAVLPPPAPAKAEVVPPEAHPNVTAAAEVLGATVVKKPRTVEELRKKAADVWPAEEARKRWAEARSLVFQGETIPKTTEWTADDVAAMDDKMFEPEAVPF